MGVTSRNLIAAILSLVMTPHARADDLPPLPTEIKPKPTNSGQKQAVKPSISASKATKRNPTERQLPVEESETDQKGEDDFPPSTGTKASLTDAGPLNAESPSPEQVKSLRMETAERLAKLPKKDDKDSTAAIRALRELVEERLNWLDDWEKAVKDRTAAENPEQTPEKSAAEWKADLERITSSLSQTAKDPDSLLPKSFRKLSAEVSDAIRDEMKQTIDSAQNELKEWSSKREQARANPSRKDGGDLATLRSTRDQTFRRVSGLKARGLEREAAVNQAKNPEARDLAREKLLNFQWESRVENERLRGQEARLALETKRADLAALNLQRIDAHVLLSQKTLDRMKVRYGSLAARQERELQTAAVKEKSIAKNSDDPLERYRAKRTSELLELEAKVLKSESALSIDPSPSLEEQKAKTSHAETDFVNVKKLLEDGKVSHLDALRLNNDFRRIGTERATIVRNELAIASNRLTLAENVLSGVELDLINDARDDRYELDSLVQTLPRSLHPRANVIFDEIELKHTAFLVRERDALQKLADRAEQTHDQILKRIDIIDDHFGFIRTHMFWVRDEEPVGPQTLTQARREGRQLGRAGVEIAGLALDPKSWGRVSPEFMVAAFGLVVFPWPFHRARKALRSLAGGRPAAPSPKI